MAHGADVTRSCPASHAMARRADLVPCQQSRAPQAERGMRMRHGGSAAFAYAAAVPALRRCVRCSRGMAGRAAHGRCAIVSSEILSV